VFKFGGWTRLKSDGEYELPVCMVGKQVRVKTDVVESDIPLLLSRSAIILTVFLASDRHILLSNLQHLSIMQQDASLVDVQIADGVSTKLTFVRLESFLPILLHGWTRLKSDGEYELPVCMVGKQVRVKTDVVESDIPLLLSR
jgi:hypothetical protein